MAYISIIVALTLILLLVSSALVHFIYLIPFVPSKKSAISRMVEAAELRPDDIVIDLGCGDGRLLTASKKAQPKIKAVGYEIAPMVFLAAFIRKTFTKHNFDLRFKSLFAADLKDADVIFCYLFPGGLAVLADKIKSECKPKTRVISNTFEIPKLKLEHKYPKDKDTGIPAIYIYEV